MRFIVDSLDLRVATHTLACSPVRGQCVRVQSRGGPALVARISLRVEAGGACLYAYISYAVQISTATERKTDHLDSELYERT